MSSYASDSMVIWYHVAHLRRVPCDNGDNTVDLYRSEAILRKMRCIKVDVVNAMTADDLAPLGAINNIYRSSMSYASMGLMLYVLNEAVNMVYLILCYLMIMA